MTIQKGQRVYFGEVLVPRLPAGFTAHTKPKAIVTATGPDGKEYIIAKNPLRLVPILRREIGPSGNCITHCDFDHPISLV